MFYYPPRPTHPIHRNLIPFYEKKGYWLQLKKNGTCQVIMIDTEGNTTFKTRHNEDNKAWLPKKELLEFFSRYPDTVFIGELLHSKHESVKDTVYLFDVIRWKGRDLVGKTFEERARLLTLVKPHSKKILIAKLYKRGFAALFDSLTDPLDEGIVLKRPDARLNSCLTDNRNTGWQVKCRRPTKNFSY